MARVPLMVARSSPSGAWVSWRQRVDLNPNPTSRDLIAFFILYSGPDAFYFCLAWLKS
jgi:hypothetical protein